MSEPLHSMLPDSSSLGYGDCLDDEIEKVLSGFPTEEVFQQWKALIYWAARIDPSCAAEAVGYLAKAEDSVPGSSARVTVAWAFRDMASTLDTITIGIVEPGTDTSWAGSGWDALLRCSRTWLTPVRDVLLLALRSAWNRSCQS